MALEVAVGINERAAVDGAKKIGKSLEDVDKKLDELAKNGGFDDIAKDADKAGKSVGKSMDDGFKKASSGAQDFKQEASQTARESAASIQDTFQELAANAFSGFGPAGAIAGTAAAVGIGVVATALTEQQEKIAALKENFADMYRSAAEEGRSYLSEAQIQAQVLEAIFDPAKREAAAKQAKLIGSDVVTVLRAEAGSREDINTQIDLANAKAAELQASSKESSGTTSVWAAAVQGLASDYGKTLQMLDDNEEAAKLAAESAARGEEAHRAQIDKTKSADQQRWEAYATARDAATRTVQQNVTLLVDDSAVRNYVPPSIRIRAVVTARTPNGIMEWE